MAACIGPFTSYLEPFTRRTECRGRESRGDNMGRMLIFTGKGGVGKTSIAAAHALKSAREGRRTLIVSTDMAHSLGDVFELPPGRTARKVEERLEALEIDPNELMAADFGNMRRAFDSLLGSIGLPSGVIDSWNMFPGMDELFSLLRILELHESGAYDLIVVDCAPTGETLSLLKFPEMMAWYMEKFFPVGKVAMRILSPISQSVFGVRLPDRAAMTDIERMYLRLMDLQTLLKDRNTTSIRLVAMPEKMVVEETKRNYMYMNLYNFHVDGLCINRILPGDIGNPFFADWVGIQRQYVAELEEVFRDLPICRIPWFDTDLTGIAGLERIVREALHEGDPFEVRADLRGERYERDGDGCRLTIPLPFADRDDLRLHVSGTDLILRIGGFKRSIPLPATLRNLEVASAKLEEGELRVRFGSPPSNCANSETEGLR